MDRDAACIPLGHILTYFSIREKPDFEEELGLQTLDTERASRLKHVQDLIEISMGMDHYEAFLNVGVDLSDGIVKDRFISTGQVVGLVDQAVKLFDMPYLGLFIGNIMTVSHYGMAGLAVVCQPSLHEACLQLSRFCSEYFPPLDISAHVGEEESWMTIEENISLAPYTEFFIELNFVSIYNMLSDLAGGDPDMMPTRIEFAYPKPPWGHLYQRYFNCPVYFDRPQNRMIGHSTGADKELPLANRLMALTAEKAFLQRVPTRAMKYLPLKLRNFLIRSYGANPSLDTAAREMGLSSRTLRRKLAEEGTSYKNEVEKIQARFAREYFARGGNSVTELSTSLGFAHTSAFSRAFKRWTGQSPSEYLERLQRR